jgi:hypothetical protein
MVNELGRDNEPVQSTQSNQHRFLTVAVHLVAVSSEIVHARVTFVRKA